MPIFISYAKKPSEKKPKRSLKSQIKEWRLKRRKKIIADANKLIEEFKKTKAGNNYMKSNELSEKSRNLLIKNMANLPNTEKLIGVINEKIWNDKREFFNKLILYAKEKKASRKVIKYLKEQAASHLLSKFML